jgi:hypothetical protein
LVADGVEWQHHRQQVDPITRGWKFFLALHYLLGIIFLIFKISFFCWHF